MHLRENIKEGPFCTWEYVADLHNESIQILNQASNLIYQT